MPILIFRFFKKQLRFCYLHKPIFCNLSPQFACMAFTRFCFQRFIWAFPVLIFAVFLLFEVMFLSVICKGPLLKI